MGDALGDIGIEYDDAEKARRLGDGFDDLRVRLNDALSHTADELRDDPPRSSLKSVGELAQVLSEYRELQRQHLELTKASVAEEVVESALEAAEDVRGSEKEDKNDG